MHCCALSRLWSFLLAESHCPLTRTKCRTIFRLKGHEHMQMTYVHAPSAAICQDLHFQRALCSKFGSCSQSMKEESMTKNLRMASNQTQSTLLNHQAFSIFWTLGENKSSLRIEAVDQPKIFKLSLKPLPLRPPLPPLSPFGLSPCRWSGRFRVSESIRESRMPLPAVTLPSHTVP